MSDLVVITPDYGGGPFCHYVDLAFVPFVPSLGEDVFKWVLGDEHSPVRSGLGVEFCHHQCSRWHTFCCATVYVVESFFPSYFFPCCLDNVWGVSSC